MTAVAVLERQSTWERVSTPSASPLGNTRKVVSHQGSAGDKDAERILRYSQRRRTRAELQKSIKAILPGTWVGRCGEIVGHFGAEGFENGGGVTVRKNETGDGHHLSGRIMCGSVHVCTKCSPYIKQEKANEIQQAAGRHLDTGGVLYFVTLAPRHWKGCNAKELMTHVAEGFTNLQSGRKWTGDTPKEAERRKAKGQKRRTGMRELINYGGYVRAFECTHGGNGWHPHVHILYFLDEPLDQRIHRKFCNYIWKNWGEWVKAKGYGDINGHGVDIKVLTEVGEIGAYLAKVGDESFVDVKTRKDGEGNRIDLEIARGDLKKKPKNGNRTPFMIAEDFAKNGEMEHADLFEEYYRATKGKKSVTWSNNGLRERYGLGKEQKNEDIVNQDVGGDDIVVIEAPLWYETRHEIKRAVRDREIYAQDAPSMDIEIVEAADANGAVGVLEWIRGQGIPVSLDMSDEKIPWLRLADAEKRARHLKHWRSYDPPPTDEGEEEDALEPMSIELAKVLSNDQMSNLSNDNTQFVLKLFG